jgi:thymidylate synthase
MYITAPTLDDLMRRVYEKLLNSKNRINPTKGPATEISGVLLKIANPRMRLSRTEKKGTLFSCLGELLWYLAGSQDVRFISYYLPHYKQYSDDGKTIYGAYGPRMCSKVGFRQIDNVINLLKKKSESRQAVIQLFNASDIVEAHKDVPCTCTLQFLIRQRRLNMITNMRSNDAFLGLPHDIFAFTMLQEIIARTLSVELGTYKHAVGSLHLYDENRNSAQQFLDEGWQLKVPMPPMPVGDPWHAISVLLSAESKIRRGQEINFDTLKIDPYWADLVRILQIFQYTNIKGKIGKVSQIKREMHSNVYSPYINKRHAANLAKNNIPEQKDLFIEPLQGS